MKKLNYKMAGMLPGVEAARRRRIYQGSAPTHPSLGLLSSPSSRRSSFALFSAHSASSLQRSRANQVDEKLGQLAREAKERLDERLRARRESLIQRNDSDLSEERMNRTRTEVKGRELRTEVYGSKKKLIGWAKKRWEQQECAVCLEEFRAGDNLVNLPCSHRFHSRCLVPWLHTSAQCPCCRMSILS